MQSNDTTTAEPTAALQSAVPALQGLSALLDAANAATLQALRDFAADNADLQRLEQMAAQEKARQAEFNLFQELNLWWQEDVHSRVLTWLLGPNNSHGAGDYFLKRFLSAIGVPETCLTADWSKAESQREWYCVVDGRAGWLDVLVTNHSANFACAIENKIFAPEGGRQLTHYRMALEVQYPCHTRRYVFLSPSGMEAQWEDERKYWKPMTYATILQLVEQTIDHKRAVMSKDARSFLRQYAATLRREIVSEPTEIQQLARKIYLEHKQAMDLIIQHKPDLRAEMQQIIKEAIAQQDKWKLDGEETGYVYFRPLDMEEFDAMKHGWAHPMYPLLCFEFHCPQSGNACFRIEIVPETEVNQIVREKLIERFNQLPQMFSEVPLKGTGWLTLHESDYIIAASDMGPGWDDGDTRAKIAAWVKNFAAKQFPAMNDVIVNCLREHEQQQPNAAQ